MGDFYNLHEARCARKSHQCTWCAEPINKGDTYTHQTGVYDGSWYTSKMHSECFEAMCEDGDGEYMPYSNERPTVDVREVAPC